MLSYSRQPARRKPNPPSRRSSLSRKPCSSNSRHSKWLRLHQPRHRSLSRAKLPCNRSSPSSNRASSTSNSISSNRPLQPTPHLHPARRCKLQLPMSRPISSSPGRPDRRPQRRRPRRPIISAVNAMCVRPLLPRNGIGRCHRRPTDHTVGRNRRRSRACSSSRCPRTRAACQCTVLHIRNRCRNRRCRVPKLPAWPVQHLCRRLYWPRA